MIEVLDKKVGSVVIPQDGLIIYNAEVKIQDTESKDILYINVDSQAGSVVSKTSIHEYCLSEESEKIPEGIEFLEEYETYEDTKQSKYFEYFDMAYDLIEKS